MLCHLCLSFARLHLPTIQVAVTHTPPHTSQPRSLITTPKSPTPPGIPKVAIDNTEKQNSGPFHHYPHYRELESSASAGCELCSLIANSMPSKFQQNQRQAARQKDKPVQFWLIETPRRAKRDDRAIKLRFRVNIATETNVDKFRLHLELYGCSDPELRWQPWTLEDPPRSYPIEQSVNSEIGYKLAAHWLQGCSRFHGSRCGSTVSVLPTRVLDVGDEGNGSTVKIYLTKGEEAPYTALSHCWGPPAAASMVIITTSSALASHQAGITIIHLPRNFQDAIIVTRKLRIRYLWIDSLCIIQDLATDWSAEAGKMGDYYSRATVTLSALCALTSHGGFLHNRWPNESPLEFSLQEFEGLSIRKVTNPFGLGPSPPPLWQRAWVVQERALASRILHFGAEQMYWECRTSVAHEDGSQYPHSSDSPLGPGCSGVLTGKKQSEKVWHTWYMLVEKFSRRALTKESDRLPALGGLASRFAQLFGSEYLCGLWKSDLHRGLLWARKNDSDYKVAGNSKAETYPERRARRIRNIERADEFGATPGGRFTGSRTDPADGIPSWSWAALGRPVKNLLQSSQLVPACEFQEAKVTSTGPVFLGQVSSTEIRLYGFLVKAVVERFTKHIGPRASLQGFENLSLAVMDFVGTGNGTCHFLHVASEETKYHWLVLEPCGDGSESRYHRIGTLCVTEEGQEAMLKLAEKSTVTII